MSTEAHRFVAERLYEQLVRACRGRGSQCQCFAVRRECGDADAETVVERDAGDVKVADYGGWTFSLCWFSRCICQHHHLGHRAVWRCASQMAGTGSDIDCASASAKPTHSDSMAMRCLSITVKMNGPESVCVAVDFSITRHSTLLPIAILRIPDRALERAASQRTATFALHRARRRPSLTAADDRGSHHFVETRVMCEQIGTHRVELKEGLRIALRVRRTIDGRLMIIDCPPRTRQTHIGRAQRVHEVVRNTTM